MACVLKKVREGAGNSHQERAGTMTKKELAGFDGREGRKAYVAVNGKVFDVTASPYWQGGNHQNAHQAGTDLSADLLKAPHVRSVIERFPVIAVLEEMPVAEATKGGSKAGMVIAALLAAGLLLWFVLR
jgi:predicted heme/steroid binding protein